MDLTNSFDKVNLNGILEGTSQMMKMLEEEEASSTKQDEAKTREMDELFEDEAKRFKSCLIKIAKASHHRTFMETCLNAKSPPRNMRLWVEPHIYHSSKEVEKEWRETLTTASLKLLSTLIKHYTRVITTEKNSPRRHINRSRLQTEKNWKQRKQRKTHTTMERTENECPGPSQKNK